VEINFGSTDLVDEYEFQIERILTVLGYPDAFVTDLSQLSDFIEDDKECIHISDNLGISVWANERLVDVAKRMKENE
jgi:hypothetical protein